MSPELHWIETYEIGILGSMPTTVMNSRWLTKWADALPFTDTKETSMVSGLVGSLPFDSGYFYQVSGDSGLYIDDFEAAGYTI